jgi:hypothetical protein
MVMSLVGQSAAMRVMVWCLDLEVDGAPGVNAGGSVAIDLDEKSRPPRSPQIHGPVRRSGDVRAQRFAGGAHAACALGGRGVSAGERGRFVMSERGVAVALDADAERGCRVDGPC